MTNALVYGRPFLESPHQVRTLLARHGIEARDLDGDPMAGLLTASAADPLPAFLLADSRAPGAGGLVARLRGLPRLFAVPVVWTIPAPTDTLVVDGFRNGADDVLDDGDLAGLVRRLPALVRNDPSARPPALGGIALVAHPSDPFRALVGRVLRLAGFDVRFVEKVSESDLLSESLRVVVASSKSVSTVLRRTTTKPLIVTRADGPTRRSPTRVGSRPVAMLSESAPLHDLLFLVNELTIGSDPGLRTSSRRLMATIVSYRAEGELAPRFGATFNAGPGGVFVRTLDPVDPGLPVWIELKPSRPDRIVHLRGTVAWSRALDTGAAALGPPGFGVRFDPSRSPREDVRIYSAGIRRPDPHG